MPLEKRELYRSSNGDRWFLAREPETGRLFVGHEANIPSGGQVTDIDRFFRRRPPASRASSTLAPVWNTHRWRSPAGWAAGPFGVEAPSV